MNIHHLELFYHVARHGGISSAVRHMPYAIQQPAVSSQIRNARIVVGTNRFSACAGSREGREGGEG
jgi:DNA-binding transcriptional LysR family regulator